MGGSNTGSEGPINETMASISLRCYDLHVCVNQSLLLVSVSSEMLRTWIFGEKIHIMVIMTIY